MKSEQEIRELSEELETALTNVDKKLTIEEAFNVRGSIDTIRWILED